jgi:hypothetical protein
MKTQDANNRQQRHLDKDATDKKQQWTVLFPDPATPIDPITAVDDRHICRKTFTNKERKALGKLMG